MSVRERRIHLNRNTENLEKILSRVNSSLDECECIAHYDFVLPNYDLDTSVAMLEKAFLTGEIPHMAFNAKEYKHRMQHLIWLLGDDNFVLRGASYERLCY